MYIYSEVLAKEYVVINCNGSMIGEKGYFSYYNFHKLILASFVADQFC